MNHDHFKQCPGCHRWLSLQDILTGRYILPLGLVLSELDYRTGQFYFHHDVPDCRSSFVILADELTFLIDTVIPADVAIGTERCRGRCVQIEDYEACHNCCHYAPFRRLLIRMMENRTTPVSSD